MLLSLIKNMVSGVGLDYRTIYQVVSAHSLESAIREQGLVELRNQLREIIPDISDQYDKPFDREAYNRYWEIKMRGMHAFQMSCVIDAVRHLGGKSLVVADIGDSSGNHARYIQSMVREISHVISVNKDEAAIKKVRSKGGEAVLCRAEDLKLNGRNIDLFMSFEMLEHLTDPTRFLHKLAVSNGASYLLMTVPYRRMSRVGLLELRSRNSLPSRMTAEDVHIFELSPEDWLLLARFAGWTPIFTRTYLQYPRYSFLRVMAPIWEKLDFEGFWGALFQCDLSVAQRYVDW